MKEAQHRDKAEMMKGNESTRTTSEDHQREFRTAIRILI